MQELAPNVRELARRFGSHSFDAAGEHHVLKFVCMDSRHRLTTLAVVARDDPRGGRLVARHSDALRELVQKTHDRIPNERIGSVETIIHCAPFEGVIFAYPPTVSSPAMLHAMGIPKTTPVKLSDGKGLGKTQPRLSETKFAFLCPGGPPNVHKSVPGDPLRASWSSTSSMASSIHSAPPSPSTDSKHVYDELTKRVASSRDLETLVKERALRYLDVFRDTLSDESFGAIFRPFCGLPSDASAIAMADKRIVQSLVRVVPPSETSAIDALYEFTRM